MAGHIQFQTLPVAIPVAVIKAANLSVGLPIRAVVGKNVAVVPFLADTAAALRGIGAASVVTLDDSTLALAAADSERNSTAETAPLTTIMLFEEESQEWARPTGIKGIRDRLLAWTARTEGATLLMCCGSCLSALPELRTTFAESGLSWRVLHRVYAPVPSSRDGQEAPAAARRVESTTLHMFPPRQLRTTTSRDGQPESGSKAGLILDFDWTMIECNSDPAVIESLGALQHLRQLSAAVPRKGWTQLMDEVLLHAQTKLGKGPKDIEAACDAIKVAPELVEVIRRTAEAGTDVVIVSDANSEYIRRILESNGMSGMVGQVHTNPAVVQENVLRVLPHNDPPPLCPLCPSNMCKGSVVGDLLASAPAPHSRLVYCGDGGGDFCPSSLLGPQDFVLTRRCYPGTDGKEGSKMTPLYRKLTEQGATFLQLQAAAAEAEVGVAEVETSVQVTQGLAADTERRMVQGLVAASCIAWDTPSELATAIEALLLRDGL